MPLLARRRNAVRGNRGRTCSGQSSEQVVDMARLTDIAAPALRPMRPMIRWQKPSVHAVVDDEGRGAAGKKLFRAPDSGREATVESRHQNGRATGVKELRHRVELRLRNCERLLHENMLACAQ